MKEKCISSVTNVLLTSYTQLLKPAVAYFGCEQCNRRTHKGWWPFFLICSCSHCRPLLKHNAMPVLLRTKHNGWQGVKLVPAFPPFHEAQGDNKVNLLGLTKTFTENQDSMRHLLDLSWHIQRLRLNFFFLGIKLFCFSR